MIKPVSAQYHLTVFLVASCWCASLHDFFFKLTSFAVFVMDDTNLHLTIDLGSATVQNLSRLNTALAIDIGPNISKAAKYIVCGIVACKVLQVTQLSTTKPNKASKPNGLLSSVLQIFYWQETRLENHQMIESRNKPKA